MKAPAALATSRMLAAIPNTSTRRPRGAGRSVAALGRPAPVLSRTFTIGGADTRTVAPSEMGLPSSARANASMFGKRCSGFFAIAVLIARSTCAGMPSRSRDMGSGSS